MMRRGHAKTIRAGALWGSLGLAACSTGVESDVDKADDVNSTGGSSDGGGPNGSGGAASGGVPGGGGMNSGGLSSTDGGQAMGGVGGANGGASAGGQLSADGGQGPGIGGESGGGGDTSSGGDASSGGASSLDDLDVFGITQMYPTVTAGLEWDSAWWNGDAHELTVGGNNYDAADPLMLANQRGTGTVTVNGDGTLSMTGSQPRIYLATLDNHPWLNVEITVYYQRLEDAGTAWAGLVVGARSGPNGHGTDNCTATTYYARFRHDGDVDVEKELEHPASEGRESQAIWDDAPLPTNTWIGMKYIVTNQEANQHVRLQVFRDLSEGEDGGTWEPLIDTVDEGGWSPDHACAYEADHIIVQGGGAVFVRNTDLSGPGALYKWLTVREIDAQ